MEAKEKAKELVDKFLLLACWGIEDTEYNGRQSAKAIAIIAVNEIAKELDRYFGNNIEVYNEEGIPISQNARKDFWNQVKQEIEKL